MLTSEVIDILNTIKINKSLIITVGNTFRSDDGIGPFIFDNLKNFPDNIDLINAGDKPENIIDEAINSQPNFTLIIDTAVYNGLPGEAKIIPYEIISEKSLSTHTFPIKIIARLIKKDTNSNVFFLGIQPLNINFGNEISKEVLNTANDIINILSN